MEPLLGVQELKKMSYQHYLVGSICNSIGEPSAKLHNVCENPKKHKSHSNLTVKLIISPIDSSSHSASKTLVSESKPITEGLKPIPIIDLSIDNTKTNIKDKVKLVND